MQQHVRERMVRSLASELEYGRRWLDEEAMRQKLGAKGRRLSSPSCWRCNFQRLLSWQNFSVLFLNCNQIPLVNFVFVRDRLSENVSLFFAHVPEM
jgi:hypothetical protein